MNETTKGLAHERAKRVLDEVGGVAAQFGVTSKDKEFLGDLIARQQRTTSPKQDKWLGDIERKVFTVGGVD